MTQPSSRDRPREKLGRLGVGALGDSELLALVLGSGTRRAGALALAALVLEHAGGLHGLPACTGDELRRIPGVGAARAAQVLASVELGRRTLLRQPADRPQLLTPGEVATHLLPEFGARPVEQFGIVLLDTKHRLIRTSVLTVGTLDRSVVHPREVFREAASARAAGIVLFHNHPSGDPTPSADDVSLTRRLVAAGELMGIDVLDHLVLTATRYVSLREIGRLR
ncbi:MAG: DNA repair protein RadC [Vicinamibacterales bacterium]